MPRVDEHDAATSMFVGFLAVWSAVPVVLLLGKLFGPFEVDHPMICVLFALPASTGLLLPLCMIVLPRARGLEWWLLALQQFALLLPMISGGSLIGILGGLGITAASELAIMGFLASAWWVLLPTSLLVARYPVRGGPASPSVERDAVVPLALQRDLPSLALCRELPSRAWAGSAMLGSPAWITHCVL